VETTNGVKRRRCARQDASHFLFLFFSCFQDLVGVSREMALGISIGDTDNNDAICSVVPKTTDNQVSSVGTSVLMQVAGNCGMSWDQYWHLDCGAASVD
jgi:hypothetical protein